MQKVLYKMSEHTFQQVNKMYTYLKWQTDIKKCSSPCE